jgi:hypothetical protein
MMTTAIAQHAAPCLDCGTRWGWIARDCSRPARKRGYCHACYQARYHRGEFEHDPRPLVAAPYPADCTHEYMVTHAPNGDRHRHALPFAPGYDPAAVEAEAEAFAARWLAEHPSYLARWSTQEDRAA